MKCCSRQLKLVYPFIFTATIDAGKPKEDLILQNMCSIEETVKFMIQSLKSQKDLQGRYLSNNRVYTSGVLAE